MLSLFKWVQFRRQILLLMTLVCWMWLLPSSPMAEERNFHPHLDSVRGGGVISGAI